MKRAGYSLIELSIVLAILAIILTIGLARYNSHLLRYKQEITQERLARIGLAIERFAMEYRRLPCPAALAKYYLSTDLGREVARDANGCDLAAGISGDYDVAAGDVPIHALHLSAFHLYDGWGNRFAYIVGQNRVADAAFLDYTPLDLAQNPDRIYLASVNANTAFVGEAAVMVISYGDDGIYSYDLHSSTPNQLIKNTTLIQAENRIDAMGIDRVFAAQLPQRNAEDAGYFDDLFILRTSVQLLP